MGQGHHGHWGESGLTAGPCRNARTQKRPGCATGRSVTAAHGAAAGRRTDLTADFATFVFRAVEVHIETPCLVCVVLCISELRTRRHLPFRIGYFTQRNDDWPVRTDGAFMNVTGRHLRSILQFERAADGAVVADRHAACGRSISRYGWDLFCPCDLHRHAATAAHTGATRQQECGNEQQRAGSQTTDAYHDISPSAVTDRLTTLAGNA